MISVIIPSRGESAMLWTTVASAKNALEKDFAGAYEIIVVMNEPRGKEFPPIGFAMKTADFCEVIFSNVDGPAGARNLGYQYARGDFLFFVDAHCLFPEDFFLKLKGFSDESGADAVFGGTRFIRETTFGCKVGWDDILWGRDLYPEDSKDPFPVVSAGHGAFGITRAAFADAGKYWEALRGWGGEEPQLNLKFWMMGKAAWIEPRVRHWHFMPNKRHMAEEQKDRKSVV